MDIREAIQAVKDVGLNVYTPKNRDIGFVKLYLKPTLDVLPKLSGNAVKVLIALSSELEWNHPEVVIAKDKIASLTGLSEPTVRAALDELEERLIIKRLGPNIRRSYVLSNHYVRLGKKE